MRPSVLPVVAQATLVAFGYDNRGRLTLDTAGTAQRSDRFAVRGFA